MTYLGHLITFRDLDLRSNFEVDLLRSKYTWLDSFRRDKHDHYYCSNFQNEKVIREKLFCSKQLFWLWWPVEAKRSTLGQLGQIWRQYCDGEFNSISNAVFGFVLAIIVPGTMEGFRSDVRHSRKTRRFCIFCPWGHNFEPREKNDRNSLHWVFTIFRMPLAACLCDAQEPT